MATDEQKQATKALFTGHYPYMMQALLIAMQRCMVWRTADTDEARTYFDLFDLAKQTDETHPLEGEAFYMVSQEGAIGLCAAGKEYLVRWLYVPMEGGEERKRLLAEVIEKLNREEAKEVDEESEKDVPPPPPIF